MRKRETYWGFLFILAAALILLGQFGLLKELNAFSVVISVLLGGIALKSLVNINFWGFLFPIAIICIIFSKEWNIEKFTPWPVLFTAFCLSVGLSLIFGKSHNFGGHSHHHSHHDSSFSKNVIDHQDEETVKCTTSFGECIKYVNSDDFKRADIKCSFGATKVYFDHALIPSGKADIYLDVSFGEAKLYIPRTWNIFNDVHVFCGDAGVASKNLNPESPNVTIHGNVSFGDAKIYYV